MSILLVRRDDVVTAVIEDDGARLRSRRRSRPDSLGLEGMRERVELHDGRLTIETAPGSGTTLRVEVPL